MAYEVENDLDERWLDAFLRIGDHAEAGDLADRRLYPPLIGAAVVIAGGLRASDQRKDRPAQAWPIRLTVALVWAYTCPHEVSSLRSGPAGPEHGP